AAPVGAWLAAQQRRQAALREAEHASLEDIQRWSGVPWRYRLFESLVVFQDGAAEAGMASWFGPSVALRRAATPTETAYPMTLLVGGVDTLALDLVSDARSVPTALGAQLVQCAAVALRAMASEGLDVTIGAVRAALPAVRP